MEKAELIEEIIELHRRVNRALRQSNLDAWMQISLTVPQVKSLFFITNHEYTNFKNLATALRVTQSNLTGVIDRLVEQGLVSRTENPEDRRMMLLKATDKGEALVSELRDRRLSHLSQTLSELSPHQLNTIAQGLALLAGVTETQVGSKAIVNPEAPP
jgi:DNA-binding MarR family transcriptional regulator